MTNAKSSGSAASALALAPARALHYPFDAAPSPGGAIEVAPGVLWLRLDLPGPLAHINLWAIEESHGWTIVDTGLYTVHAVEAWESLLAGPLRGRPVIRVIATHLHPDHVGMAGWLTKRFDCQLWMTRVDYLHCKALVADTGREPPQDAIRFYHRAGWDQEAIAQYRERFGRFGRMIFGFPDSYRRIVDGEWLTIGGRAWQVVVGRGHTPEHACLLCPELGLLISGDQVLPRISSNVSVHPTEPDANPIGEWLDSIRALRMALPGDVLVLPAHNEPFNGLHQRLARLEWGVIQSLARLRDALAEPRRAVDAFVALFGRQIGSDDASNYGLATGEAVAHLNYLMHAGEAIAEADSDGVQWYVLRERDV